MSSPGLPGKGVASGLGITTAWKRDLCGSAARSKGTAGPSKEHIADTLRVTGSVFASTVRKRRTVGGSRLVAYVREDSTP